MLNREKTSNNLFLLLSSLAFLFVLLEIALQSFGKTICPNDGCKIVGRQVRFGEISILIMGAAEFLLLAVLSFAARKESRSPIGRLIDLILIVSLACEGFFMGYLAFGIHTLCLFCVIIFGIIVTLSIIRWAGGARDMLVGFAALIAVFSMQYLVLPAAAPVEALPQGRLVLFFSKECKHCEEIMKELEEKKIAFAHAPVSGYASHLKSLGIEGVPTLLVNDPNQKLLLTGTEAIRKYFDACAKMEKKTSGAKPPSASLSVKPESSNRGTSVPIDIFSQQNLLTVPSSTSEDPGLCKQDEACK